MSTIRTATSLFSRRTGTYQRNVAVDVTNTPKGQEILAKSEATDSAWRALLAGKMRSIRVVRVDSTIAWGGNWDRSPLSDYFIEVETDHGTACMVQFKSRVPGEIREEMLAFVSNSSNQAFLAGTWRKRGGIVGHACGWLESFHWSTGRRLPVKRSSKYVDRCCRATVQMAALFGAGYDRENRDLYIERDALTRPVYDRAEVRYAQHVLTTHAA